jgi:hypothetical protein
MQDRLETENGEQGVKSNQKFNLTHHIGQDMVSESEYKNTLS